MRSGYRFVAVTAVIAFVAACGPGGGGSTAPSQPASQAASQAASSEPSGGEADICTAPPRADGTTLTFASYGGAYQKAQHDGWLVPYSELTGVTFSESEDSSNATIKSQVENNAVEWDIVDVGNDFGLDANADLLEPLDYTKIHKDEIIEGFASTYRVADITYGVVLAYNTDKTGGKVPEGWADYFDLTKFPGTRGVYDYSAGGIFEIALMADGVSPADFKPGGPAYPLDLDRATAKLDTIKDSLAFWGSGAESQDLIGKGEYTMSLMWNGRAYSAKNIDGKPVEIQWNQQIVTADFFVVPKGTPNKDAAMDFIAWATCAENNAAPSNYIPYGPTNTLAEPAADKVPDLSVSNADNAAYFDDAWYVENAQMIEDAYQAWKTK
jgi:putative spermidine/putrescine transport system substrate-binding protein